MSRGQCIAPECERADVRARGMCSKHYQREFRETGPLPKPSRSEYFWSHVTKSDGCWMWTGKASCGYGKFWDGERWTQSHRYAYEVGVGPIPDGMQVDHACHTADDDCPGGPTCRHRSCVNPEHLRVVEPRVNVLAAKNAPTAINARKTHCIRGHEFTPENTYRTKLGRECRTCRRERRPRAVA